MRQSIVIDGAEATIGDGQTVIIVPAIAVTEPGYIKTYSNQASGNTKHDFHALAQMVYFQFQDGELAITEIHSPVTVSDGEEHTELGDGLLLCRDRVGGLHVLAHAGQNKKKLLEAAYRYCTRWVRLDI
jgi:hypothetical protein